MKHSKKNGGKVNTNSSPIVVKPDFARTYVKAVPMEKLKKSLHSIYENNQPLEELLNTCEATFTLIRHSELEVELRNAFWVLEKQFDFWKKLVERG
jgi:hypothetical protein